MSKFTTLSLSFVNLFFKKLSIEKIYKKLYLDHHNIYVKIKGARYSFIYRSVDYDDLNMMCRENLKYWESSSREIFSTLSLISNCAVDIGSYTGVYTLVAAKTNNKIKTISFEPNPELYAALVKNMKINRLKNSKLEQLALDKEIGSSILYLNHEQYTSVGSLIKSSAAGKQVSVNKTTLDVYCAENKVNSIDLMKIDVEGYEINILEGSKVTLEKYSPIILMEALTTSALESQYLYLNQFGYLRPAQVKGDGYDKSNWLWFTEKNLTRVDQVSHLLEV